LAFCLKFMPFYHLEPNDNHKITEYFFPYEKKKKDILWVKLPPLYPRATFVINILVH